MSKRVQRFVVVQPASDTSWGWQSTPMSLERARKMAAKRSGSRIENVRTGEVVS